MAYDLAETEFHSRLVKGHDGLDHLISIEGWAWNYFDWLDCETTWKSETVLRMAWTVAKKMENDATMRHPGNFSAEFGEAIKALVWYLQETVSNQDAGLSNDNVIIVP